MSKTSIQRTLVVCVAGAALLAVGVSAGLWWAQRADGTHAMAPAASAPERKVLYWYDPMTPTAKFDKPGKSPFMDMQLVPKYADDEASAGTVRINPAVTQNLGMRLATVTPNARGSVRSCSTAVSSTWRTVSPCTYSIARK